MTLIERNVVRGECVFEMGRDLDPRDRIEFDSEKIPNPSESQDAINDSILNEFKDTIIRKPGFELGSLIGSDVSTRLNF